MPDSANAHSPMRFHHICLEVEDLSAAATSLAKTLGAGPFFGMEDVTFEELDYPGGECVWEHSLAFGYIGSMLVELSETHRIEPPALAQALASRPVQHFAYLVDDLKRECTRVEADGAQRVLYGRNGPVELVYYEVSEAGIVELLQDNEFFSGLSAAIAAATADSDGTEPYQLASSLG